MSNALGTLFSDIGDAIRNRNKGSTKYYPNQMAAAIRAISAADLVSGTQNITANGDYDITDKASVHVAVPTGSSKNVQYVLDKASVHTNGYTSTGMTLTVAKTGTYKVSWVGWRSSSSGTMGSRLYIGNTAQTAQTTFTNTYGQQVVMNNVSLQAGDVLTLYATAGSTSRYMWVANLIIEEQ